MKNYIMLDGKKIPLSQETEQSLRDAQRDYEILSYKSKINNKVYEKDGEHFVHKSDFVYSVLVPKKSSNVDIYSVRRLSDGEVFTVGDKVRHKILDFKNRFLRHNNWKISSIRLIDNKIQLYSGTGFHKELNEIEHRKEDYVVCISNDYSFVPWSVFCTNKEFTNKEHFKHFPTKEKAQEYIDNHKPKYSKRQINDALYYSGLTLGNAARFDAFWERMKK